MIAEDIIQTCESRSLSELLRGDQDDIWRSRIAQDLEDRACALESLRVVNLTRVLRLRSLAKRFTACRKQFVHFECMKCTQQYVSLWRCEVRVCCDCAKKHFARIVGEFEKFVIQLKPKPGFRISMLTLTKKVSDPQALQTCDLRELFRKARKLINSFFPKKNGAGALAVLEIGAGFNFHIHALVYGPYIPQAKISDLWYQLTRDSSVVDIRQSKSPKRAVRYVLKYILKPAPIDDPKAIALYLDLITGVRRIHRFGIFHDLKMPKPEKAVCALCGGKLRLSRLQDPHEVPKFALLFSEAAQIVAA